MKSIMKDVCLQSFFLTKTKQNRK